MLIVAGHFVVDPADQAAFDAHMAAVASAPRSTGPAPKGFDVKIYDIAGERSLG
jgi:hypothetical protein